ARRPDGRFVSRSISEWNDVELAKLFEDHIATATRDAETALQAASSAGHSFEGIVLHAGAQGSYHADDRAIDFHPTPHFARFAPVAGPDHLLLVRPGARPRLARVIPEDYWYEAPAEIDRAFTKALDVVEVTTPAAAGAALGDVRRCAYVGPDAASAQRL